MIRDPAIVLANGYLRRSHAKTTHALVRSSERYEVLAIVDPDAAGEDAGELLDGRRREIPVYASVEEALGALSLRPRFCIIGVATPGGVLPPDLRASLLTAIEAGVSPVNGLHQLLEDDAEIVAAAAAAGVELLDVRKPRPTRELRFWNGAIMDVTALRVPVLGTDCAVGKRTTALMLRDACRVGGVRAELVFTGQTGFIQGLAHGFILDATPNDFVCGELERAVVNCWKATDPQVILVEGQSGLRNPSGPCGSELLVSAAAHGAILQHPIGRETYKEFPRPLPAAEDEVALIERYGVPVWGLTLNASGVTRDEAHRERDRLRELLRRPVLLPLMDGVEPIVEVLRHRAEEITR